MAEEKKSAKKTTAMLLKIVLGVVLVVFGLAAIITWRQDVLSLIKGTLGIVIVLGGIICFAIAKE
ncbi:MAG: hypothetical protein U9Q08_00735 [Candidatus Omnitrophota bacterium]|nr:hypothetical protein [Candidatus Omnitrophota bacterium]